MNADLDMIKEGYGCLHPVSGFFLSSVPSAVELSNVNILLIRRHREERQDLPVQNVGDSITCVLMKSP